MEAEGQVNMDEAVSRDHQGPQGKLHERMEVRWTQKSLGKSKPTNATGSLEATEVKGCGPRNLRRNPVIHLVKQCCSHTEYSLDKLPGNLGIRL